MSTVDRYYTCICVLVMVVTCLVTLLQPVDIGLDRDSSTLPGGVDERLGGWWGRLMAAATSFFISIGFG